MPLLHGTGLETISDSMEMMFVKKTNYFWRENYV